MEEQKLDNKRKTILIIIAVLTLTIGLSLAYIIAQLQDEGRGNASVVSDTAYIIAQLQDEGRGNASVVSDTVDILRFEVDKDISLNPTQFNVVEGGDNLSDTAVGSAILRANSTDNNATYNYYVYFQINSNDYVYTTDAQTPEIVLTITDPTGSSVTSIEGLDYVTSGGVSGFDITTKSGLYNVAELYEIISNSSTQDTIQEWEFTVSFINLDTNQAENGGKTLEGEVILSSEPTDYHKVCEEGTLACNIAKLYNEENPESNGLYYHNGTYLSKNEYCMYNGNQVFTFPDGAYSTNSEDCQHIYSVIGEYYDASTVTNGIEEGYVEEVSWNSTSGTCQTTSGRLVYDYRNDMLISQEDCGGYAVLGSHSALITEIGSGTMEKQILDAIDKSYRYAGANPNNYVCFGSDETTCPYDNLYRIIGVFNGKVKLIKADYVTSEMLGTDGRDYYGSYMDAVGGELSSYKGNMLQSDIAAYSWNNDASEFGSNNWTTSEFNKINLNANYINCLGESWSNMIVNNTWYLGAQYGTEGMAKDYYNAERNNDGYGSNPTTYTDEIGLMYASDYGYGTNPSNWETRMKLYGGLVVRDNNWMFLGLSEWTITPFLQLGSEVFFVDNSGGCGFTPMASSGLAVRPTFYLNSNVQYASGDGSIDNPYRIEI